MRVAIYARYSTDMQRDASIEDQFRLCEAHAKREGWHVVKRYEDRALSGASIRRPGIQELLSDLMLNRFDVVISESIDRLSRDQEDIAHIYKRATHAEIPIITLAEGQISELHIGLKGTMGALFLKDLAQKTRRGQQGRALAGKCAGGNSYGYDVVRKFDPTGEAIRGDRTINEAEATIIREIFEDFARGVSPKRIALCLNERGIPGPSGLGWGPTTIYGNRQRATGILNNEMYIGKLVWNRHRYLKDPATGKRISRPNPREQWVETDVPEWRIVADDLWKRVKARQKTIEAPDKDFWTKQRPPKLFSFLLKCGCCGGGMSKISKTHYGCSNARNKGTCKNRLGIAEAKLEQSVFSALKTHLMTPELCATFSKEYTEHINRQRNAVNAALTSSEGEFARNEREMKKIVEAIGNGIDTNLVKDRANWLVARQEELKTLLATTERAPVLIHPNMARRYQVAIQNLLDTMKRPDQKPEAADILRSLVEKIVLTPNADKTALTVDLVGDLAGILMASTGKMKDLPKLNAENAVFSGGSELQQVKMVAGAGFEPAAFRL